MAKVVGRVMYAGQPVANAAVTFMAPQAARWSVGTTNAQGEFQLTTFDANDGAIVGENTVTISEGAPAAPQGTPPVPDPETYFKSLEEMEKRPARLPQRYANASTSPLKVVVVAGENRPVLELQD